MLSSLKEDLKGVPAKQFRILEIMDIPMHGGIDKNMTQRFDLIIDSLLGYNQKGNPKGKMGDLVNIANGSGKPILALDVPTGLNPDTGLPNIPCIKATQTLTLALPKTGLMKKEAKSYVGDLFLADISVPRKLYQKFGMADTSIFFRDTILQIDQN